MKPILLKMQAFGSYGTETILDFRKLNQKLFLITGDTGSGKTTIFDAIVFALYGEASSSINKKDGVVLQSQYADLNVEPYVELTFTEGDDDSCYTVRRVPKHLRLLTRGTGKGVATRDVSGSVTLTMPDGTEYPSKEAGKKIEDLIGLTKDQFMQIAMIAQGEFLQLLRAKSDEKKVIFRKLFHTELYEQIVRELDSRKKELEKALATVRTECITELGHVRIPEQNEHAGQLSAYVKQIQDGSLVQLKPFLEELEQMLQQMKQERKEANAQLKRVEKERDHIRDNRTAAAALEKAYEQLDAAETALKQYESERMEQEQTQQLIQDVRTAYTIAGEYRRLQDAKNALIHTTESQRTLLAKLPEQQAQAHTAAAKETAQQEAYHHILDQTSKIEEQVTAALTVFEKQEAAAAAIKVAEKAVANLQTKQQNTEHTYATLSDAKQNYEQEFKQYEELPVALERSEQTKKSLDAFKKQLTTLHDESKQLTAQQKRVQHAVTAYEKARSAYQDAKEHFEQIRLQFLDTQAGYLASTLSPGAPCPVCGSTEHPRLRAQSAAHPELTKETLDAAEAKSEQLAVKQEQASAAASTEQALFAEKQNRFQTDWGQFCESVSAELKEVAFETLDDADAWLNLQSDNWKQHQSQLESDRKKRDLCKDTLTDVEKQLQALEPVKEQLQANLTDAKQVLAEKQAAYKALDTSCAFSEKQEALTARESAIALRESEKQHLDAATHKATAAKQAYDKTNTLLQNCEAELPKQQSAVAEQFAVYEALLAQHQFSEQKWQTLKEQYSPEDAEKMQRETTRWKEQFTKAAAQKESALTLIDGRERPDLSQLETAFAEAEERVKTARGHADTLQGDVRDNEDVLRTLQPKLEAREQTLAHHAKLDRLYRQMSGNVKGSRMDLETYVQRYFLQRILYAANIRFQEMSGGQFELRMVDEADAGDGKNRGLDLMVYSAVTGKVREIRTLSGGESFLAALSLALGMADQIKESAPGIHLDVMFLDEGFGSLDETSREQAVRVLQDMAGASRLIGIISHVTELKQEIDDQLLVTKDEHGSHIRWQIS